MDPLSEFVRDLSAAERAELFASPWHRPLRMAFLMQQSLARASVGDRPRPTPATRTATARAARTARRAPVVTPTTVPMDRHLTRELRDAEARTPLSRAAVPAIRELRRPPDPVDTHERDHTARVPLTRNLTAEVKGGRP